MEASKQNDFVGIAATGWSRFSTHRIQNEPIDAALDSLFLIGSILRDGVLPDNGIDACISELDQIGERERFLKCKSVMEKIRHGRSCGWQVVQHLREQLVVATMEKQRIGSGVSLDILASLKKNISFLEQAAVEMDQAFSGLIEPLWIERYLSERIEPLRQELGILEPLIQQREPLVFEAEAKKNRKNINYLCC